MLTAPLPEALQEALQVALGAAVGELDLAAESASLSERYRQPAPGRPVARSRGDVLAYAVARLPATFAAARAVFAEVAVRTPGFRPATQLDLGSGPGTALWAAAATWPSLERRTAIDTVPEMRALGAALGHTIAAGDVPDAVPALPHDLVTAVYLLGELAEDARDETIRRGWASTTGVLVVVEPGTPAGFGRVVAARDLLVSLGGTVVAPCPHDRACPVAARPGDWCHFGVRVARTKAHRAAKQARLGHEDEKFAYVAVSRSGGESAASRVLRHPHLRPGQVVLELCTTDGLRTETVSKRQGERFRRARKLDWGGAFDGGAFDAPTPSE